MHSHGVGMGRPYRFAGYVSIATTNDAGAMKLNRSALAWMPCGVVGSTMANVTSNAWATLGAKIANDAFIDAPV